jgi:hypothetical protein
VRDLEDLERRLGKRGFKRIDVYLHACDSCMEKAVIKYGILGRSGGRDISYCQACGGSWSWRSVAGMEGREVDPTFDLDAFLR